MAIPWNFNFVFSSRAARTFFFVCAQSLRRIFLTAGNLPANLLDVDHNAEEKSYGNPLVVVTTDAKIPNISDDVS